MDVSDIMRYFIAIIGTLFHLYSTACECDDRPLILELYTADIVFTGTAITKTFDSDSSSYIVTFEVREIYKNILTDEILFQINKTIKKVTSIDDETVNIEYIPCQRHIKLGSEWLIIAEYSDDKISFGYCSGSRSLDSRPLTDETNEILNNLNDFDISEHRFSSGGSFLSTKPIMNLDSLVNSVGMKEFEKQIQLVVFDFDKRGNLTSVNFYPRRKRTMTDPSFGLSWFENIEYAEPKNEFEELALELASKITKWTPIKHSSTGELVLGRATAFFSINEQGKIEIEY